jgi:hypothetical protein
MELFSVLHSSFKRISVVRCGGRMSGRGLMLTTAECRDIWMQMHAFR